jgi:DNA-binding transcriptional MocR family regulator
MLELEEAVARFFPTGEVYDRKAAKTLIAWLDRCGYVIVCKDDPVAALAAHHEMDQSGSHQDH